MVSVWISFVLFALLAFMLLVVPLLRGQGSRAARRRDYDLSVYRDQLDEVERDLERGLLTIDQAEAARAELKRRLLAVAERSRPAREDGLDADFHDESLARAARRRTWALVIGLLILVPGGGIGLYAFTGNPGLPAQPFALRAQSHQPDGAAQMAASGEQAMESLTVELEQRLAKNPADTQGWIMLGRTYATAQRYDDAIRAYRGALEHGKPTYALYSELAEALVAKAEGTVDGEAAEAFMEALRLDPRDPRARYYLGLGRVQADEPEAALAIWRDLERDSPDDAPWMEVLQKRIQETVADSGLDPEAVTPQHPLQLAGEPPPEMPAPSPRGQGQALPGGGRFSEEELAQIETMVGNLEATMAETPDDVEGWRKLARSYDVLGRPAKAIEAHQNIVRLEPENVEAQLSYAMAILKDSQERGEAEFPPRVFDIMRDVHALQPNNPNALYFLGLEAAMTGKTEAARTYWQPLRDLLPEDHEVRRDVESRLKALSEEG
ncbi:c-type cytochrome biogenesis protein CcmI [Roseospirillum parvum]|uniref:Cytochrome c-type biogenesis protein CcmH n=1 Tax=Roseospirillum parvum TaxID=83401 RepID=A0A1G8C427_9PROT|nr:c-type cytochrome biogenesis protein CcmI [Roseospirillum parvum]SDH40115.1 cytochrome c-type biogenesis protein CcmH [Roseospirillum parvum]